MKNYTLKELFDLLDSYNFNKRVYINSLGYNFKVCDNIFLIEKPDYYNVSLFLEINIETNKIIRNTLTKINRFKFECYSNNNLNFIEFETTEKFGHILAKPMSYFNLCIQDSNKTIQSSLVNNNTIIHSAYKNLVILDYYTPIEKVNKTLDNLIFI